MSYRDLRGFLQVLEQEGDLKRISAPVDPILEVAEITDRIAKAGGPVELVKCETIDTEVPANAEIILEGYVEELPPEDGRYALADGI